MEEKVFKGVNLKKTIIFGASQPTLWSFLFCRRFSYTLPTLQLWFIYFLPGWSLWAEIEFTYHACCSAQTDHKTVQIALTKQKTSHQELTVLINTLWLCCCLLGYIKIACLINPKDKLILIQKNFHHNFSSNVRRLDQNLVNLQYNTLVCWNDGPNESLTKHLMFQVLFSFHHFLKKMFFTHSFIFL